MAPAANAQAYKEARNRLYTWVSLEIRRDLLKQLKQEAIKEERSVSGLIRKVLKEALGIR